MCKSLEQFHACLYIDIECMRTVVAVFMCTYLSSAPGRLATAGAAMTGEDSPKSSCLAAEDDHESTPSAQPYSHNPKVLALDQTKNNPLHPKT